MLKQSIYLLVVITILSTACQPQERADYKDLLDTTLLKSTIDIARTKELVVVRQNTARAIGGGIETVYVRSDSSRKNLAILEASVKIQTHTQSILSEIDAYIDQLYNGKSTSYLLKNYEVEFQEEYSIHKGNKLKASLDEYIAKMKQLYPESDMDQLLDYSSTDALSDFSEAGFVSLYWSQVWV